MNRTRLLYTLAALIALVVVTAVYASESLEVAEAFQPAAEEATAPVASSLESSAKLPAASPKEMNGNQQSYLIPGAGDLFTQACTWYDIECSNGTTDECCASESSCLDYCSEVCGESCIVAN